VRVVVPVLLGSLSLACEAWVIRLILFHLRLLSLGLPGSICNLVFARLFPLVAKALLPGVQDD
jgi:hypothetical protein